MTGYIILGILVIIGLFVASAIRIIKEYERAVIFRLGRYVGTRGPGIILVIPVIEVMNRVNIRIITLDVPTQEIMTFDNVPVEVNAVVYFRVNNPEDSVIQVNNFRMATSQIAQTTLRSVLGQAELDELLAERDKINQDLQTIIDEETDPWGVKVTAVEVKNVELPSSMQRAMARQAEAERERRAKVIAAEGEYQASTKLNQAAEVIGRTRTGVQLRYLQTLTEISSEGSSTIVFPLPLELVPEMGDLFDQVSGSGSPPDPSDLPDLPEEDVDVPDVDTGSPGEDSEGTEEDADSDESEEESDEGEGW